MRKFFKGKIISLLVIIAVILTSITPFYNTYAASNATINWNSEKQAIEGFGVSQAYWAHAIYDLSEPVRSEVLDLLFKQDTGIGLSIFRGEIFPQFNPAKDVYDFTQRSDQAWVMQQAVARGVNKLVATTWSPPAWMKTNNQTTNGGYVKTANYQDFADLLSNFVKEYKNLYNLDMYAVSMSNEPNAMTFLSWNSCQWDSTQIKTFLGSYVKPTFISEGISNTKVIAAETSWWSEQRTKEALNDAEACSRLDIVGAHAYPPSIVGSFNTAKAKGKSAWMTEVSDPGKYDPGMASAVKWAKNMQDYMTKADANAFLYWLGAYPGNDDEGLIYTDLSANTYAVSKRYYAFGHFSKFVRPGYVRIDMPSNPAWGVYTSAYKDPNTGKFAIVAVNNTNKAKEVNLYPNGFTAGYITPYTTNDIANMQEGPKIPLNNGRFYTIIPPNSVMTFTGENESAALPAPQYILDDLSSWSNTSSHSSGMILDGGNSGNFNGDTSRATRATGTTEYITYNLENITTFNFIAYHKTEFGGVTVYASPDNVNWTMVPIVGTDALWTANGWYKKQYTPLVLLPQGTNYMKIELSGTDTWNKQISQVYLEYNP